MKKKVIIEGREPVVRAEYLTDSDFIGVKFEVNGEKGFVQKIFKGEYTIVGFSVKGNTYNKLITMSTIQEIVEKAINDCNAQAFTFNTWQELYKWLAEDL